MCSSKRKIIGGMNVTIVMIIKTYIKKECDEWIVKLQVGNQFFSFMSCGESKRMALWQKKQLNIALKNMKKEWVENDKAKR